MTADIDFMGMAEEVVVERLGFWEARGGYNPKHEGDFKMLRGVIAQVIQDAYELGADNLPVARAAGHTEEVSSILRPAAPPEGWRPASGDEVVILEGDLERITDSSLLERFNSAYDEKYSLNPESGGDKAPVFALNTRITLAWLEADFPSTATRWQFA